MQFNNEKQNKKRKKTCMEYLYTQRIQKSKKKKHKNSNNIYIYIVYIDIYLCITMRTLYKQKKKKLN